MERDFNSSVRNLIVSILGSFMFKIGILEIFETGKLIYKFLDRIKAYF